MTGYGGSSHFGRIPFVTACMLVLIPAIAVIAQLLVGAFSEWSMTGAPMLHFPTFHSFLAAVRPGHWQSLTQQVGRAVTIALIDILLAVPAGHFLVKRVKGRRRLTLLVILLLPFFINSATRAFSWTVLLGAQGPVAGVISYFHGSDSMQHALLHNPIAVGVSLVSSSLPLVLFAVTAFMSVIPEAIWTLCEEAGINEGNELVLVAVPLAKAGLLAGWIAGFIVCALASFEIDFSGGWRSSLTRANQGFLDARDPNAAMAMGVLLVCACAAIIVSVLLLAKMAERIHIIGPVFGGGGWRYLEACCLSLSFGIVLAPAVTILGQTLLMLVGRSSLARVGFSDLLDERIVEALEHTAIVALAVSTAAGAGAVISCLVFWNRKLFQNLLIASLCLAAVPGDSYAMGVSYLARTIHLSVSPLLLVAASQITWVFPFSLLTVASGYVRIDGNLLDAAWDLGASRWGAFRSLIFLECWPEILLATVVGAVLSINDSSRATILSDRFQMISEYIAGELISGTKPADYLLASFSILLGMLVIFGFLVCVLRFHLPGALDKLELDSVLKENAVSGAV